MKYSPKRRSSRVKRPSKRLGLGSKAAKGMRRVQAAYAGRTTRVVHPERERLGFFL